MSQIFTKQLIVKNFGVENEYLNQNYVPSILTIFKKGKDACSRTM
jgi:hypothetical protein